MTSMMVPNMFFLLFGTAFVFKRLMKKASFGNSSKILLSGTWASSKEKMPSKLVFDLQGAERMTSDMAPKPTFRRGNSENLLRVAPIDPPNFWNFFLAKIHQYICGN